MKLRRERCVQCARALQRHDYARFGAEHGGIVRAVSFGYGGSGYFCSAVCGHSFAVAMLREVDGWEKDEPKDVKEES